MEYGYYCNRRAEVFRLVPDGAKRILEIGCAAGEFRQNFTNEIEYWGVEPVARAAKDARVKGIKVFCGTYETVCGQIPDGYFDIVVCNDVIEHVVDSEAFLLSIQRKLHANGVVIGSIPNVRFWGNLINLMIKRDWKYEDHGVLDRTHVRFFTRKSFRRLVCGFGFQIEHLTGIASRRMTVLKVLFAPILLLLGFDICYLQFIFRIRSRNGMP